jgi:hypothetical protein
MIAKFHQEDLCYPTHVIIPQAEEAKRMTGMMNKNLPAFLHHMLLKAAFPEDFVKKLLKNTCEGSLVSEVSSCKWDSKTRTITTVADVKHECELKAFEGEAWFKDEFCFLKKGKKTQPRLPQEDLFNLNGTASVKTIHKCHCTSIQKTTPTLPTKGKEDAMYLTKEDTDGDSSSHRSLFSSSKDDDASDKGLRSQNSIVGDKEEMSATEGG